MAHLDLSFFGALQARLDGKPLNELRSGRVQNLLAYLVLEMAQPQPRAILAALFWPDEPEAAAKQNLRQVLYQLRQQLGELAQSAPIHPPFLLIERDMVQFNPASDYTLDVATFQSRLAQQQLEPAMLLYQDDLLTGLSSTSARFEEWLLLRREQLHIQALDALVQLTQQALHTSNFAQAQQYARRQLVLEPWREEAHRQLMLALARSGDRNAALAQAETCRRLLAEELGVEPDEETALLVAQIRKGDLRSPIDDLRNAGARDDTATTQVSSEAPISAVHQSLVNRQSKIVNQPDWGDAPDIGAFYGRTGEMAQLQNWLIGQRCRLIAVLGMGGMGKTTLAVQAVRLCTDPARGDFTFVIWRSLINAPMLSDLLDQWLRILSGQQLAQIPRGLDAQLGLLFGYLRAERCLLVLDNAESIMQGGERAGYYRAGYENYSQLLLRMGQSSHQSCLLITSREQPHELARLELETPLVRTLPLAGLDAVVGGKLLSARGLHGPDVSTSALIARYSGNPLALKLVAETIQDFFDGDIDALLGEQPLIFDDIRDVLEQQFARLAPLERDLLLWLAIEREPLAEAQLWQIFARSTAKRNFLEAMRSLQRRSLLESYPQENRMIAFGLQNVVTEFLTDYLVTHVCQEFATATPRLLHSHALILAQAKEYVRQSQVRMILQPVAERLLGLYSRTQIETRSQQLLATMRREQPLQPSFLAGNLLNLLLHLGSDLRGYDFSNLSVWQAYLRGADLPALDFTNADLTNSVFTDYAGAVTAVAFSPDGQLLAAGADNGVIYLWRVTDRQLIGLCQGHTSHVWSLAFSPNGQQLLSGSGDATVRLWDVELRQLLHVLRGHQGGVATVAFHSAGAVIASGSLDRMVSLWDAQTGQLLRRFEADGAKVEAVAFSPDGALLATGGHDQVVCLWDWARGAVVQTLPGHTNLIKVVGFCPRPPHEDINRDNEVPRTLLVSGGDDQSLCLWDVERGKLLGRLTGHTAAIISLAFSADGAWVLSGSDDQTIRIRDVQSRQTIAILHGHYGTVRSLAVHPHPEPGQA
ncbi:MAG: BTAD domain-containing putative transcriptional regulator, partial [Chloroflexi bacterium]|nr:BTAD domain-containing putative transcriptional regulator [Chloroflexota bacterium]